MKQKFLLPVALSVPFLWGCTDCEAKKISDPEHVQQLLATKHCPKCDLGGVNLVGADLAGADLQEAELSNAILDGANLHKADLTGAELSWESPGGNNFGDFSCNVLYWASLDNADLSQAKLTKATLRLAKLRDADLIRRGNKLS